LLNELLPRFKAEEFLESPEYKGPAQNELKEALKVMNFYSVKHADRAERGLKRAYFPEFVLSQMTLDEELQVIQRTAPKSDFIGGWSESKKPIVKSQIAHKTKKA